MSGASVPPSKPYVAALMDQGKAPATIKQAAAAIGIDGASGHSCRVGIAQSFIERGAVKTYFE